MTSSQHLLSRGFYGFLATPVLALISLQIKFMLVPWACGHGHQWTLHAVTVVFLLLTAIGAFMGFQGWRDLGSVKDLGSNTHPSWISFVLVLGILMSILSVVFVVAMGMSPFLIGVCA